MERSREEVQEFVVSRIEQWLCDMIEEGDSLDEQQVMWDLREDMGSNKMLYKEQANLLERRLEDECKFLHDTTYNENSSYLLHIDSLSIYADAWGLYCRPGTYMVLG